MLNNNGQNDGMGPRLQAGKLVYFVTINRRHLDHSSSHFKFCTDPCWSQTDDSKPYADFGTSFISPCQANSSCHDLLATLKRRRALPATSQIELFWIKDKCLTFRFCNLNWTSVAWLRTLDLFFDRLRLHCRRSRLISNNCWVLALKVLLCKGLRACLRPFG